MNEQPELLGGAPTDRCTLIGQEAAEQAFLRAWHSGRLAHAWLLSGPKGVGKASLAFHIARFVLAGGHSQPALFGAPDSLAIAPDHPVSRRIASGGHADFRLVERGWTDDKQPRRRSEITVDEVRDIGAFLSMTPAEGGWRVVIVDAVDEINRNGANALLKILEEPPKQALLLLVAHNAGRLLPTLRSRCRLLALPPLSPSAVIAALRRADPKLDNEEAAGLTQLAEGSIGRAMALHSQGGLALYRDMVRLLEGLPHLRISELHDFADRFARQNEGLKLLGVLLTGWLAQALRLAAGGSTHDVSPQDVSLQRRLMQQTGIERCLSLWEGLQTLFDRADAVNLDGRQVVLNAFLAVEKACRS